MAAEVEVNLQAVVTIITVEEIKIALIGMKIMIEEVGVKVEVKCHIMTEDHKLHIPQVILPKIIKVVLEEAEEYVVVVILAINHITNEVAIQMHNMILVMDTQEAACPLDLEHNTKQKKDQMNQILCL